MASPQTKCVGLRMDICLNALGQCHIAVSSWSVAAMRVNKSGVFNFRKYVDHSMMPEHVVQCQDMAYWVHWTFVLLLLRNQRFQFNCCHCMLSLICCYTAWPCCKNAKKCYPSTKCKCDQFWVGSATTQHQVNGLWIVWKRSTNFMFPAPIFFSLTWNSSVPIQFELLFDLQIHFADMEQLWIHWFAHLQIEQRRRYLVFHATMCDMRSNTVHSATNCATVRKCSKKDGLT